MIVPDLVVPMIELYTFKYFKEETLEAAAAKYSWILINDSNRKTMFMDMVRRMDMRYSYKPVLMLAVLACAGNKGRMKLSDLVRFFRDFYADHHSRGLVVEKPNRLYCREDVTDKEIERNILINPFKRYEDMQKMRHTKTLGIVEVDSSVWKHLTDEEKAEIREICVEKLEGYYNRLKYHIYNILEYGIDNDGLIQLFDKSALSLPVINLEGEKIYIKRDRYI